MPLKRDENGGRSNSDGPKSTIYCSKCYANGKFLQPDISVVQMQALVKEKMMEFGFPGFLCGFFTKEIPKLKRWQKD
ncbi:zinc ribbon domain-containing protein [Undibacterium sp. TS12]|nr:zinc ribbon domain-containing protein [Undibacterium sp. TS12]